MADDACRARTVCRLWELKLRDFLPLAHHTPGAMESMVEQARGLTEATQSDNAGLWERSLLEIKVCAGPLLIIFQADFSLLSIVGCC